MGPSSRPRIRSIREKAELGLADETRAMMGRHLKLRNQIKMDEYNERKKKWYLDVKNTPCAREALIYGLLGGLLVGSAYFVKTNIIKRSCDWAVASFVLVSFGTWEVCRLKKAKQRADIKRTVNKMNKANAIKGDQTSTDQMTEDIK